MLELCVLCLDHRKADVTIGRVRYVSFGKKREYSFSNRIPSRLEREVKAHISQFKPDVIHIHGTEYYFGRFSDVVYCGIPVLVSLQGIISACHIHYTGGLAPKQLRPFEFNLRRIVWGTTLFRDQTYWREVRVQQEAMTMRKHRFFAGRTGWDCDWVRLYNTGAECFHLNETLRPPFWQKRRDSSTIRRYSIYCSAASGYPLKGCHWLLQAVFHLKRRYPSVQLRIAAADPRLSCKRTWRVRLKDDCYAAYLRWLIKKLDLTGQVVLLPSLSAESVTDELANAHVFCLPSLCENSPNSLGEAMLVGTPIVATYVGGIPSVLRNAEEGLLCPSADVAALVSAISRLFDDEELSERYAEKARETALRRHSPSRNALDTLEVYRSVIKRWGQIKA
jgi:glycosyltransferase involved in cell wall biosynthesis